MIPPAPLSRRSARCWSPSGHRHSFDRLLKFLESQPLTRARVLDPQRVIPSGQPCFGPTCGQDGTGAPPVGGSARTARCSWRRPGAVLLVVIAVRATVRLRWGQPTGLNTGKLSHHGPFWLGSELARRSRPRVRDPRATGHAPTVLTRHMQVDLAALNSSGRTDLAAVDGPHRTSGESSHSSRWSLRRSTRPGPGTAVAYIFGM